MATNTYAGIGSRETPSALLARMHDIARERALNGWILRSGAASGADTAFEQGAVSVGGATEIYLPWRRFQGHLTGIVAQRLPTWAEAAAIAEQHHPAWHKCNRPFKALLTRNVFQILGTDLRTPVQEVLFFAPTVRRRDGRIVDASGGTGLAIRLADTYSIPVQMIQ